MDVEFIEPEFESEIADHLNEMAAELAELREIAERVTPAEEDVEFVTSVADTLGKSVGVLPGWAV